MNFAEAFQNALHKIQDVFGQREAINILKIIGEDLFETYNLKSQKSFSDTQKALLDQSITKLLNGTPVQYITNRADFMGLKLYVDNRVLIPRPETEELVDWVLYSVDRKNKCKILDVGTGSGCIPIALSVNLTNAFVDAIDISEAALEVARINATKNHANIHFINKDILIAIASDFKQKYDIIVSNPPYISKHETALMGIDVLKSEPHLALFAGEDPLIFYKKITVLALELLEPGGLLYFELNPVFAQETKQILQNIGFTELEIKKDLQSKERMLKGRKALT